MVPCWRGESCVGTAPVRVGIVASSIAATLAVSCIVMRNISSYDLDTGFGEFLVNLIQEILIAVRIQRIS